MDFTELIRKSNLAKKEITKTRKNVEEIKTALIENGVDQIKEDTKLEEIGTIIKETDLGSGKWKRPTKWIEMPTIVQEDSVYMNPYFKGFLNTPQMLSEDSPTLYEQSSDYFTTFKQNFQSNKSKVTTGTDSNGTFNVSANDFAYVMLCDISKNNDENILSFEGFYYIGNNFISPFTEINTLYNEITGDEGFWSDLFIQIDNEEPFNLSELARGNIDVPTSGKYKGITILDSNYSYNDSANSITDLPQTGYNPIYSAICNNLNRVNPISLISLFVSLDYNDFSDETINNDNKQCIIKIWGNSFITLWQTVGSQYSAITGKFTVNNNSNLNSGIRELSIVEQELSFFFESIRFPALHNLLTHSGNNLNKLNIYNNCSTLMYYPLTSLFISDLNDVMTEYFDLNGYTSGNLPPEILLPLYPDKSCSIKELDLSNSKIYDNYISLLNIVGNTPESYPYFMQDIFNKLKAVESIKFPNINELMENSKNEFNIRDMIDSGYPCLEHNPRYMFLYTINLSNFPKLNKDTICNLINALPTFNKKISEITMNNVISVFDADSGGGPDNLDSSDRNDIIDLDSVGNLFRGNKELIKKITKKQFNPLPWVILRNRSQESKETEVNRPVVDNSDSETNNQNTDTEISYQSMDSEISTQDMMTSIKDYYYLTEDERLYNYILVSQYTYNLLTNDDLNLALEKGWKICTGYNFSNNHRTIGVQ